MRTVTMKLLGGGMMVSANWSQSAPATSQPAGLEAKNVLPVQLAVVAVALIVAAFGVAADAGATAIGGDRSAIPARRMETRFMGVLPGPTYLGRAGTRNIPVREESLAHGKVR